MMSQQQDSKIRALCGITCIPEDVFSRISNDWTGRAYELVVLYSSLCFFVFCFIFKKSLRMSLFFFSGLGEKQNGREKA